ncbi:metal ABC transporter ATP-binding protein [Tenuibacillus multivorans]|uniref:Zinc transport system ATP-binding protein n=1 Tax=Tenuibacillus multivorans TaxID=237069 RepID=A0A1H0DBF8_9BACI|nr:metal ABC transporter ATP-binding protein [Tenuibacillus multivorans]GEL76621.1 zinc ABC transporter ATP-binding protein [Tenuibacillus multivorans]SDN67493.1 zinc transport system ATP-binding protein [Tenuibacillus multivorans]
MANPIISVENVSHRYEQQNVLEDINFNIHQGSFVGLVGPNGSGKTTLIKLMLGIEKIQRGSVKAFGKPIQKFKNEGRMSYVSQKANAFTRGFPATVREVVSMGIVSNQKPLLPGQKSDHELIVYALKQVHMKDYLNRNIGDLSGGQQQRVFIARAIVNQPELLILDEPTVGVDSENVDHFYQLLSKLNQELGITLVLVTHDIGSITTYVTDLLCLNKSIHYHGDPSGFENMTDKERSKLYGHSIHTITHDH